MASMEHSKSLMLQSAQQIIRRKRVINNAFVQTQCKMSNYDYETGTSDFMLNFYPQFVKIQITNRNFRDADRLLANIPVLVEVIPGSPNVGVNRYSALLSKNENIYTVNITQIYNNGYELQGKFRIDEETLHELKTCYYINNTGHYPYDVDTGSKRKKIKRRKSWWT